MKTFYNEALEQDTKALMITLDGLFFYQMVNYISFAIG
jgi:hypothetical protein